MSLSSVGIVGAGFMGSGIALAICLALLEREPETYPRAAAKWASRFAIERRLTLTDAQLALAALAALPTESARAGAEALIELAERYRLERIDELLTDWSERRVGTETPN